MNYLNASKVMLSARSKIVLPEYTPMKQPDNLLVMTFVTNVMTLGYMLSSNLIDVLENMPKDNFILFAESILEVFKDAKGVTSTYKPLFKNFPSSVMDADEATLIMAAVKYCECEGCWDDFDEKSSPIPIEDEKYILVGLATYKEYCQVIGNYMSSSVVLPRNLSENIEQFFHDEPDAYKYIPDTIAVKENVVTIAKACLDTCVPIKYISKLFKTATDILRFAVALCDGDTSLKSVVRFKSLSRKERKFILALMEGISRSKSFEENMLTYKGQWIRLGEVLHPGEFKQFVKVNETFSKLRNSEKIETYNGKLEAAIAAKDDTESLKLLSARPGVFARKLDQMLRTATNTMSVVDAFRKVATEVPVPLLLQLREHFSHRSEEGTSRVFFPKGNASRAYHAENVVETIDAKYTTSILAVCENAITTQLSKRDGLGSVYVDPAMKQYVVPFAMREASKTLKQVAKGSKFPIDPNAKILRPFIHWQDGDSRTDIDLSVVVYDKDYNMLGQVAYYDLSNTKFGIYHSGDITSAPVGASEYVDIDMEQVKANGGRYVAVAINSFTMQPYCDLPICFGGWMERSEANSGEVYEPTTVTNKFDISGNQKTVLIAILDTEEKCMIWADMSFENMSFGSRSGGSYANNVNTHLTGISAVLKSIIELHRPNMYDLFVLNAKARGILVDNRDDADFVFAEDPNANVKPTDIDLILADYL